MLFNKSSFNIYTINIFMMFINRLKMYQI